MTDEQGLLDQVKHLIEQLPAEYRQSLIPFLAGLPDSGLRTYNATEEIETLKKHGKRIEPPPGTTEQDFLVGLTVTKDRVIADILGTDVLYVGFYPENFIRAFPQYKNQTKRLSDQWYTSEELRETRRRNLEAQGIHQDAAEFEKGMRDECDRQAAFWMAEKATRIAEQISRHLPGMVGDMLANAIKGQTFYDFYEAFKALKPEDQPPSVKDFKKLISRQAVKSVEPHLPSTRHIRTHPDWQREENKKLFAQKVNERKALANSIKDKYEECDFEAGWIEDLKQDSTYLLLSVNVPQEVIDHGVKRVASELSERERQPLSIALEMARKELGFQEQDIETLHKYYAEGVKLLKADRNRPPSSI